MTLSVVASAGCPVRGKRRLRETKNAAATGASVRSTGPLVQEAFVLYFASEGRSWPTG